MNEQETDVSRDNVIAPQLLQSSKNEITAQVNKENAILDSLEKQNELLSDIYDLIALSTEEEDESTNYICSKIVGINMPFSAMIIFMTKLAIAAIPATIILLIVYIVLLYFLGFIIKAF